jgi:hypothetical protein
LIWLHRGGSFCCCCCGGGVILRAKVKVFLVAQPVESQAEWRFAARVYKENTSSAVLNIYLLILIYF